MFIALDAQGEVTLTNRRGSEILGMTQEAIIGRNWFDSFIPARSREEVRAYFNRLIAGEVEGIAYNENPIVTAGGVERIIAWHNTVLVDEAGKVTGTLSSGEDITDRKHAEAMLRRNLVALQQAESLAQLGYFQRNWQTGEGYWSPGFFTLLGYSGETDALPHTEFMEFVHEEDKQRVTEHIQWSLAEHQPMDIEFRLVQKDGHILDIYGVGHNTYTADGQPLMTSGTFQNISERKRAADSWRPSGCCCAPWSTTCPTRSM